MKRDYFEGADVAVTICAKDGTILDMNQKSRKTFLKPGREEIIGQNVLEPDQKAQRMNADIHCPILPGLDDGAQTLEENEVE